MKPCDCVAGGMIDNKPTGEIVIKIPDHIFPRTHRQNQMVSIDGCIAYVIEALWELDIATLGCCCGHNKANPTVIVSDTVSLGECDWILEEIAKLDTREWEVCQWRKVGDIAKLVIHERTE